MRIAARVNTGSSGRAPDHARAMIPPGRPSSEARRLTPDDALQQPAGSLLAVRDLRISLKGPGPGGTIVDGLSFALAPGEVLGIVGESGCGKTVTARSII